MAPIIKPEGVHSSPMPKRTVGKEFFNGVTPKSPAPGRGKGFWSETMAAAFNYGTRHNGVTPKSPAPGRGEGFWSETMGAAFNYNGNCSGNHNGGTFESPSPTKIPAKLHPRNVAPIKEEIVHADDDYIYVEDSTYREIEIVVDKVMRNRGDKDLIQRINGLLGDNSNLAQILVNTQGNLESKEQQVQKLTNELSELQIENRSLESGLGNGNGTNSNALLENDRKFAALQGTFKIKQKECEGLAQDLHELKITAKKDQGDLRDQLTKKEQEASEQLLKSQHEYRNFVNAAKDKEDNLLAQLSKSKKDQETLEQVRTKQVDKVKQLVKTISNMSDTSNELQLKYQVLDQNFKEVKKEKTKINGIVKCLESRILILRNNMLNTKTESPVVQSVPQTEPPVFSGETAFPALPVALPVQSASLAMVPLPSGTTGVEDTVMQQKQQQVTTEQHQHCLAETSDNRTHIEGTMDVKDTDMFETDGAKFGLNIPAYSKIVTWGNRASCCCKSRKKKSWDRVIPPQNFAIATAASSATPAASPYAFGSAEAPAPAILLEKKKLAMESLEFSQTEKLSFLTVKTKYRQLVRKYHPDKNLNRTPEYQAGLSKKTREILAAKKFLRDYIFHSYGRNTGTASESRPWIKQTSYGPSVSQDDAMDLQEEDQSVKAENVIGIENKLREDISCSWSKWLGFCKAKRKSKEFERGYGLDAEKSKKEFNELSQKHCKDVEDLKKRMPHTFVTQSCNSLKAQIKEHLDKMKEQLKTRLLEDGEKCNKTVNEAETADELELDTMVVEEEIADVKDNAMETADTTAVENKSEIAESEFETMKTECRRSSRLRAKSNNCDHSALLKEGHLNDIMIGKIQEKWKEVTQNWDDKVNSNKVRNIRQQIKPFVKLAEVKVVDQDDNMETSG